MRSTSLPSCALAIALLGLALGCASDWDAARGDSPDARALRELRAKLAPTGELGDGFTLRQHLRFQADGHGGSFEAVVELHCGELLVVGLTPLGTRAFSIRQRGLETEFEWMLAEPLPFSPERILLDVHRSFLYPLPDAQSDALPADGLHARRFHEIELQERWSEGRLMERALEEKSGERVGRWVARYAGGVAPGAWPMSTSIESGLFGYSLEITTLSWQPLACTR